MTFTIVSTPAPADSPLFGHHVLAFDWDKAGAYVMAQKARGVTYGLGCKIDTEICALGDPCPHFVGEDGRQCLKVDCSGIMRGIFAVATLRQDAASATPGHVTLPDGSYAQDDWAAAQALKVSASDAAGYLDACGNLDNITRLCFIHPNARETIGHVFLVRNRRTLESHGGCGPDSRPYDTPVLALNTCKVYAVC